jgi:hypothetical protein
MLSCSRSVEQLEVAGDCFGQATLGAAAVVLQGGTVLRTH